jgi:hypothetical protein
MSYEAKHPYGRADYGSSTGRLLGVLPHPAESADRRENLAWGPLHMLASPHTPLRK